MSKHHAAIKDTPEWKAVRRACLERDGHACIQCGSTEQLEADHIIELSVDVNLAFDLDNLRTLCKPCHLLRHAGERDGHRLHWVNPKWAAVLAPFFDNDLADT